MKKFILVMALVISALCAVGLFVEERRISSLEDKALDSATVSSLALDVVNPIFCSTSDVMQYQQDLIEDNYADSVIAVMPSDVLLNVATVVMKQNPTADKYDIVREFREHSSVYLNLPTTSNESEAPTSTVTTDNNAEGDSTEAILKLIGTTSINYKDTIIDGKKVREKITTHVTYE